MKVCVNSHVDHPYVCHVRIYVTEVKLEEKAVIKVLLEDDTSEQLKHDNLVLEGTDYEGWGTDDSYVKNWVLDYYGFTEADTTCEETVEDGY